MRDPADAALGRGGEQRLGRRACVRRAVVPEDSQPGGAVTAARIVNMQRAPITQGKIGFCHHVPSLTVKRPGGASQQSLAATWSLRVQEAISQTLQLVWPADEQSS
jgi:hypothetical protein